MIREGYVIYMRERERVHTSNLHSVTVEYTIYIAAIFKGYLSTISNQPKLYVFDHEYNIVCNSQQLLKRKSIRINFLLPLKASTTSKEPTREESKNDFREENFEGNFCSAIVSFFYLPIPSSLQLPFHLFSFART